jgi:hypothetical protein
MSQLVKTKRQANFKDFKRFGAFKGFVEQKNVLFNSHSCYKESNLHMNSLNKLLCRLCLVVAFDVTKENDETVIATCSFLARA